LRFLETTLNFVTTELLWSQTSSYYKKQEWNIIASWISQHVFKTRQSMVANNNRPFSGNILHWYSA